MEENNNKIMLASILGLVIVFAAVGTFLVFSKINESDSKMQSNTNQEEEQVVALDVNGELVSQLTDYTDIHSTKFYTSGKVVVDNLTLAEKYEMAFKEIDKEGIILGCDLTTMNEINQSNDAKVEDCFAFEYEIPEQNLEKAMKKVLGENAIDKSDATINFHFTTKWKYKDLSLQKGLSSFQEDKFESFIGSAIYYDKTKKIFVGAYETQGGGWADDGIYSKVESASKKEKLVTITEKVIFIDLNPTRPSGDTLLELKEYNIYSDYNHSKQIGTLSIEAYEDLLRGSSSKGFDTLIDSYHDKALTVVYTFEENSDGSYHFVSSEVKK